MMANDVLVSVLCVLTVTVGMMIGLAQAKNLPIDEFMPAEKPRPAPPKRTAEEEEAARRRRRRNNSLVGAALFWWWMS